jgi:hypothetical protein
MTWTLLRAAVRKPTAPRTMRPKYRNIELRKQVRAWLREQVDV